MTTAHRSAKAPRRPRPTRPGSKADIAIVGGGVGGLAAAVALGRVGKRVLVFERRTPPLRDAGVLILWSNGVNALRDLGLADPVIERGVPVRDLVFRSWSGRALAEIDIGRLSDRAGAPSVVIHRRDLLAVLRAAAPCEFGRSVRGFDDDADGVTIRLDDGAEVRAGALVASDGMDSRIRARLVADGDPRQAYQRAWVGTAEVDAGELEEGTTTVTHGRGARFCIASYRRGTVTWLASVNDSRLERTDGLAALREVFRDAHAPIPAILEATPPASTFETPIRYRAPVERWGSGRVSLLGDAAHPCTPDLAQGACQALEDAVVLSRTVAQYPDVSAALREYERTRLPHANRVANISWIVQAQGAEESSLYEAARDLSTALFLRMASREIEFLLSHRP
jgi:2-polyprenyl-6-methoxyphenol hydroxylase-like FAD-dependent oxidoreductase